MLDVKQRLIWTEKRRRFGHHLDAHCERHDRETTQRRIAIGHIPAKRMMTKKKIFVDVEITDGHDLFTWPVGDDRADERKDV